MLCVATHTGAYEMLLEHKTGEAAIVSCNDAEEAQSCGRALAAMRFALLFSVSVAPLAHHILMYNVLNLVGYLWISGLRLVQAGT